MSAPQAYRDLRYVRVPVDSLDDAERFAGAIFGLQLESRTGTEVYFRSDARNYALCCTTARRAAVALAVGTPEEMDRVAARLDAAGHRSRSIEAAEAAVRQIKAGIVVAAPNGVEVEIVLRPMTSGWPFHGPRATGIEDFAAVQLASTDIDADRRFWTDGIGAAVSDWVGEAAFLRIDEAHHRIALYPSDRDGLLGATWRVARLDDVMRNWYHLQASQCPVVHGPGRQPTSNAIFVTTRGLGGLLLSYAAEMEEGPQIAARGPRQFADVALSHCGWGSRTEQPEFLGKDGS